MKKFILISVTLILLSASLFSHEYIMKDGLWTSGIPQVRTQKYTITSLTGGNWDNGYYDLALDPSNQFYYFYGNRVTHLRIWTNGYATFGFGSAPTDTSDHTNDDSPDPDNPNSYAAPWWDDWDLSTSGVMEYGWKMVVDLYTWQIASHFMYVAWKDVAHKDNVDSRYTFYIEINFANDSSYPNTIGFGYIDTEHEGGINDRGGSGTIGIEHYTGWQSEKYSYNTKSINNNDYILFSPFVPIYDSTDFWGDSKPDLCVFRPDSGKWYERKNDLSALRICNWGKKGDVALPGQYDIDVIADECVYRPGNPSIWFIRNSSNPSSPSISKWGITGDIPVPADYDNDGKTDIAVFRTRFRGGYRVGHWYIKYSGGGTETIQWGTSGDIPLPADYDIDGKADCAVYRPSNNYWYIRKSSNPSSWWVIHWGAEGDIPFPANFHSNLYSTICVYRPSNGTWYAKDQLIGGVLYRKWGIDRDLPVPNDWDSGGTSDWTVFRPSNGLWYIDYDSLKFIQWGTKGDKPRCKRSFKIK